MSLFSCPVPAPAVCPASASSCLCGGDWPHQLLQSLRSFMSHDPLDPPSCPELVPRVGPPERRETESQTVSRCEIKARHSDFSALLLAHVSTEWVST